MTISEAINQLEIIQNKYGPNIKIFFDCPKCQVSFDPDVVVTVAVHLSDTKK